MEIKDLSGELINTFLIFNRCGNISKAADELGLSQPAVTNQLKRFESSFPLKVFTFEGRKKVLTNYGHAIHEALRQIEQERKTKLAHINAQYLTSEKLMLRIGMRKELAWRAISKLQYDGPVEVIESTGTEALQRLSERKLDVAVTQEKPRFENVITVPLMRDSTEIVVHKDWARNYGANWFRDPRFLTQVPCLFYKTSPPFLESWFKHCGASYSSLKPRLICDDWPLIIRGVEDKKGYCIIPDEFEVNRDHLASYKIPEDVIPSTHFYAYFFPELTSIPAFGPLIKTLQQQGRHSLN